MIEVTFWETIVTIYPELAADQMGAVTTALSEYDAAAGGQFSNLLNIESIADQVGFTDTYNALLDTVEGVWDDLADLQSDLFDPFNDILDSINRGIDVLIRDPLTLAFQTVQLVRAAGKALRISRLVWTLTLISPIRSLFIRHQPLPRLLTVMIFRPMT